MKVSRKFYFILLITSNVFGMKLPPESLLEEKGKSYLNFTLFGGSATRMDKFTEINRDSESNIRYFSTFDNSYFKKLSCGELDKKELSYLYKRNNDELSILFSYAFSVKNNKSGAHVIDFLTKKRSRVYANLISNDFSMKKRSNFYADLIMDAFSIDKSLKRITVYAPFIGGDFVSSHAEFMEMTCNKKENKITIKLKIVNSCKGYKDYNEKRDHEIRNIFSNFNGIELEEISHVSLGIQGPFNQDCNVFTNAFLYLQWKYNVNPEHIKNYKKLHETMKLIVNEGVVYKPQGYQIFQGESEKIRLSKKIGEIQRLALDISPPYANQDTSIRFAKLL